jgi:hypothetical protein
MGTTLTTNQVDQLFEQLCQKLEAFLRGETPIDTDESRAFLWAIATIGLMTQEQVNRAVEFLREIDPLFFSLQGGAKEPR